MCAMRRGHMLARGRLTLDRFAAAKHLVVRPAGQASNLIDHVLESRGLERRMALTVDQFLVVPAIISSTDLVAALLRHTAEQLGVLQNPHLVLRSLALPPVQATLLWHPTMTHHKAHRWMREILVDTCRAL